MANICFICSKSLSEGDTVAVEHSLQSLKDASINRDDRLIEYIRNVTSVTIHINCRKDYTRKSSINSFKRQLDKKRRWYIPEPSS